MTRAYRDDNQVTTMIALSSSDGSTVVPIQANPTNNALKVSNGTSGTDQGSTPKDANYIPVLFGVSSADGVTPVAVYADVSTGALLIKST